MGMNEQGYGAMPKEDLSFISASSLKAQRIPTLLVRATSALMGKAYVSAGQAGACLHTMVVVERFQEARKQVAMF